MSGKNLFGVTGCPVLHSKSPAVFNSVFAAGDSFYLRLACSNPGDAIDLFKKMGLKGMNVTSPFKIDIMKYLDHIHEDAAQIGSVNTVVRDEKGLTGYNTDHVGVVLSIAALKLDMSTRKVLVLGAGGAGRAAVYGLVRSGIEVTLVNRTDQKAAEIANEMGCRTGAFSGLEDLVRGHDLIISTVPPGSIEVKPGWLNPDQILFDASYQNSDFESISATAGCRLIHGEDWLYHQALPAYSLFTGTYPPDTVPMKECAWRENPVFRKKSSIALIGFMGSGKTAVGKALAEKLGYSFVDIDQVIEEKSGMNIPAIFRKYGEVYFRKLEHEALIEQVYRRRIVISFGGGTTSSVENRTIIRDNMISIWLYSSIPVCLSRINSGTRPLLDCSDPVRKATELFHSRVPEYAQTSDLVVDSEYQIKQAVDVIYDEINKTFRS